MGVGILGTLVTLLVRRQTNWVTEDPGEISVTPVIPRLVRHNTPRRSGLDTVVDTRCLVIVTDKRYGSGLDDLIFGVTLS